MTDSRPTLTRRGMLAAGGAAILGAAGGYAVGVRQNTPAEISTAPPPGPAEVMPTGQARVPAIVPFHGSHQAGVSSPSALHQTFIGLDLLEATPDNADAALRLVSDDAARLTQGQPALGDTEPELAVNPAGLTVTVGLGRPLFERAGRSGQIPPELADIPPFSTDRLEDRWSQTDLLLQVGSDDPLTLAHSVRMLTKDLSTLTRVVWTQPGFRSPAPASPGSGATRNLMGQVDGIVNPEQETFDSTVWIADGPPWARGGTVMVLRRIRMHMDEWDILDRATQETVIGREVATGAPLGGEHETDPVPFDAVDDLGLPVIPHDAHIRVAHAASNEEMILRRPYSYDNGMLNGTNDVGLLFAAYMRDPRVSFIPMQARIAESDAFNRWNTTIGSSTYVIPAGAGEGGYVGAGLFA